VVLRRDLGDLTHVGREDEVAEELRGLLGVGLHIRELRVVQLAWLLQKTVADGDLAVVVEQGSGLQPLEILIRELKLRTDDRRVAGDALAVPGRLLIARVDRRCERLDEREPQALLGVHELRILDGHRRRRGERTEGHLVLHGELAVLLVDRLEHADDSAVVPGHRQCEQVARVEPGAPVRSPN